MSNGVANHIFRLLAAYPEAGRSVRVRIPATVTDLPARIDDESVQRIHNGHIPNNDPEAVKREQTNTGKL